MRGVRSPECAGLITRMFHPGARKRPNIGMHATRDTNDVIKCNRAGGRVMPALEPPECSGLIAQDAQAGAVGRSNKRMHATADTRLVIYRQALGAARDARRYAAIKYVEILARRELF